MLALLAGLTVLVPQSPTAAGPELPEGAPAGMEHIDREGLSGHAAHLASDELGGRYTGTEGQLAAARYIADHFEELGLEPWGDGRGRRRSFLQEYPLERVWMDPEKNAITVGDDTWRRGFAVIPGKGRTRLKLSGEFVWCGDGSPDEIAGRLRGRIPVVALPTGPRGPRAMMAALTVLQRARSISRELRRRGAPVALYCVDGDAEGILDAASYGTVMPGKPLLAFDGDASALRADEHELPAVLLGPGIAGRLRERLEAAGEEDVEGVVELRVEHDPRFHAVNVVARLEGANRRAAGEAVLYSAHMDHMGTRLDGDPFNGADDNASGTAALLEIAEAFARGETPPRSILFVVVSGEELGLWGSKWFTEHPTYPLRRVLADINIDMIGRATRLSGADGIAVTPSHEHSQYSTLVRSAAQHARTLGLELSSGDRYYRRSDHYNFARAGIPVVFFTDGEHADYHKVTDHADKLDPGKMLKVARLAYWTGWTVASSRERPRRLGSRPGWSR